MAKFMTDADRHFRSRVALFNGDQEQLALEFGVDRSAISHRLHTEKNAQWWLRFKDRRRRRRQAARMRRYRERVRTRTQLPPGGSGESRSPPAGSARRLVRTRADDDSEGK